MRSPPDAGWDEYNSGLTLGRDLQTHTRTYEPKALGPLEPVKAQNSLEYFTCEGVHQFRGFYIIEVGSSVPGRSHHLLSAHQPIGCDHHPLVAFQGCRGDTNGGAFTGPVCLPVCLVFIGEIHIVVKRGLI